MNVQESVCDPVVGAEQAEVRVVWSAELMLGICHTVCFHKIISFLLKDVTNGELKGLRAV